ncbi:hypothetical protein KC850_02310 [Candidatus Kaiserbacteria bacterium]|nr:hypothetical protein [Candidatus Kaiserbacteria bacterium]MCB9818094.1 hypothetical protein [Candidatus Nomurabacteria bacterium]
MKTKRLWAYVSRNTRNISVLLLSLGLFAALPASAQSDLPSSSQSPLGDWTRMHPSSFPATAQSAYEQCERSAGKYANDFLTSEKCDLLFAKLMNPEMFTAEKQCRRVLVKDKIVFDFMNGRVNGQSGVAERVRKMLGREDWADMCPLDNGAYAYFFRGDPGKSCNNVGFVFEQPAVILPSPPKPHAKAVLVCNRIGFEGVVDDSGFHYHDDVLIKNCGQTHFVPSHFSYTEGTLQSNGYTEDCVPVISQ